MFVATIGFFDGVHLGHQCLLQQVCEVAKERGVPSLVVTFDRHPREVIVTIYVPSLLTTTAEKCELLRRAGVVETSVLHFDKAMSMMTAGSFMQMMRDEIEVGVIVMGYDHRFGHNGDESPDYDSLAAELGMEIVHAHELPHLKASSSEVRRHLLQGNVEGAAKILGYPYRLQGTVVHGKAVGRQLGFPTANVEVEEEKLIPASGVYAVWVSLGDGGRHAGMLNIGHRPTLQDTGELTVEVYVLDYEGDLYDATIQMEMVRRLREEQCFDNVEALALQLKQDADTVRALLR